MISKESDFFENKERLKNVMILFDHIKFNLYFGEKKKKLITVYLVLVEGGAAVTSTDLESEESSSIASTNPLQVSSKPRIFAIKEAILN